MAVFDRSGYAKVANGNRTPEAGFIAQSYLVRSGALATFLEDPEAAKASGALPLAPPSRTRMGGP